MSTQPANKNPEAIGILDIGSNSVRCVVFEPPFIGQRPVFNEKVQCGLGRDLGTTGLLNEEAMKLAFIAVQGFSKLAEAMKLPVFKVVGTAALRDAENGAAFVELLESQLGIEVQILCGDNEARYSALGVLSTFPQAEGVVGDLGGGSLELALLRHGEVKDTITIPVGVLRVMAQKNKIDFIEDAIKTISENFKGQRDLYVVGGTWRAVARAHMRQQGRDDRPNGYHIPAGSFVSFSRMLSQQDPDRLMADFDVEHKRAELLPAATLVLSSVTRALGAQNIIISNAGLRDGILMDILAGES